MFPLHSCSEGHERQLGDLEILLAPRDPDNGNAEDHAEQRVGKRQFNASKDDPHQVQKKRYRAAVVVDDLFTERVQ